MSLNSEGRGRPQQTFEDVQRLSKLLLAHTHAFRERKLPKRATNCTKIFISSNDHATEVRFSGVPEMKTSKLNSRIKDRKIKTQNRFFLKTSAPNK